MKDNPFEKLKFSQNIVDRDYLNLSELNIIENLYYKDILSAKQKNVLQYFLFVCYTGLRYTDIKNLKYKDLKNRFIDDKATKFIKKKCIKQDWMYLFH